MWFYSQICLSNYQKYEFSTHPKTSLGCGKFTVWSSGASESLHKPPYQTIFLVFSCQHQLIGLWHTLTQTHVLNANKDDSDWIIECSGACCDMISQFGLVWYSLVWLVFSVEFASEACFPSLLQKSLLYHFFLHFFVFFVIREYMFGDFNHKKLVFM